MGWPQITLLVLYGLALAEKIKNHGKTIIEDAWAYAKGLVLLLALLYAGGFFG